MRCCCAVGELVTLRGLMSFSPSLAFVIFTANACVINSHRLCRMPAFIPGYLSLSLSYKSLEVNCKAPCSVLKISRKTTLWVQVERDDESEKNYILYPIIQDYDTTRDITLFTLMTSLIKLRDSLTTLFTVDPRSTSGHMLFRLRTQFRSPNSSN